MKKRILYISTNDGSDTRINKEMKTLSSEFDIIFLGVGSYSENNFAKKHSSEFYLIQGKRNTVFTMLKHVLFFLKIIVFKKIHSIHIINEQLMIFFYPFLFFHHVVLDLFDSRFLKYRIYGEKMLWLKKIVYFPTNKVLVTDLNRKKLMPKFLHKKIIILENFPYLSTNHVKSTKNANLTILFSGSLIEDRGLNFLQDMLNRSSQVRVIMAGWIPENETEVKELTRHENVTFLGTLTQQEIAKITTEDADYILCMYPPKYGLINASPNKLYDGIQCSTPVIINSEVKVSKFVKDNKTGYVLPSYYEYNSEQVLNGLIKEKNSFIFTNDMKSMYSWEKIENQLILSHHKN